MVFAAVTGRCDLPDIFSTDKNVYVYRLRQPNDTYNIRAQRTDTQSFPFRFEFVYLIFKWSTGYIIERSNGR